MSQAKDIERQSAIEQGRSFLSESVDELKKVTTPTRAETIQATIVTLVIMFFVAICLFIMDWLFNGLTKTLLS